MTAPSPYPMPPVPPQPVRRARRWPWFVGIVVALFVGIGIGSAATGTTEPVASTDAPASVEQAAPQDAQPEPAPEPAGPATEVSAGTYEVGTDLAAGRFKTAGPPSDSVMDMCTWSRAKDDSGDLTAVISSGFVEGPGSVTINAGEFATFTGDCTWTRQ